MAYKFYATLLDAFQRYLDSEEETAFQEFIDKVNRVQFYSEAAAKGTAFNNLVDLLTSGKRSVFSADKCVFGLPDTMPIDLTSDGMIRHDGFEFPWRIVEQFAKQFKGCLSQFYIEGRLNTPSGEVLLYGYIDEIKDGVPYDIKTTGRYEFPKYLRAWQHIVYCHCLAENGFTPDCFQYQITDFRNIYGESYDYRPDQQKTKLINICQRLIDFIETNKHLITDAKIYGENLQAA